VAPADDQLNAVVWMQTSIEYRGVCLATYAAATRQLDAAVAAYERYRTAARELERLRSPVGHATASPGHVEQAERLRAGAAQAVASFNALIPAERGADTADEPLAVIVDVDETVLDNLAYQVRMVESGGQYDEATWKPWVEERRARAVPGALAYAQHAAAGGVTVFYVTNRKANAFDATADNLVALGFPLPADRATLLPRDDARGFLRDKVSRRKLVDAGYRVVALVGDTLTDFIDPSAVDPEQRLSLLEPYAAWWGERWFMLPNPSYGSWLDAARRCKGGAPGAPRDCMRAWLSN
jgi:acid phosphatase